MAKEDVSFPVKSIEEMSPSEMAAELLRWRNCYLDKPEDRLWHDSDRTWWTRQDDSYLGVGSLRGAPPPKPIQAIGSALFGFIALVEEMLETDAKGFHHRDEEIQGWAARLEAMLVCAKGAVQGNITWFKAEDEKLLEDLISAVSASTEVGDVRWNMYCAALLTRARARLFKGLNT